MSMQEDIRAVLVPILRQGKITKNPSLLNCQFSDQNSSSSRSRSRSYRNIQTLSGVIRHEAQIISVNHAEVKWPTIRTDFIEGNLFKFTLFFP